MSVRAIIYLLLFLFALSRTLSKPIYGILIFVFITYVRPEVFSYGQLAPLRLPFVTSIVLLLSAVLNKNTKLTLSIKNNITLVFLFLMSIMQIISSTNAINSDESYFYAFAVMKIVFFCYLLVALIDDKEKLMQFLNVNVIAGGVLVLWSVLHHFHGNERLEDVGGGGTATSNGIAALFLLLLPLIITRFGNNRKVNLLVSLLCFTTCIDIIFTQSRSAFVGLVVGGLYFLYAYPSKRKYLAIVFLIIIFPIVAANTSIRDESFSERIHNMLDKKMEVDSSGSSRKLLWGLALDVFSENVLLGVGQQQFKYHSKQLMDMEGNYVGATDAHNTFLLVMVEGGIFALSFYVLSILSFFYYTYKIRKICINNVALQWLYKITICLEFSLIGFLVTAMAHSFMTLEYFYWILVLPSALLNLIDAKKISVGGNSVYPSSTFAYPAACGGVIDCKG